MHKCLKNISNQVIKTLFDKIVVKDKNASMINYRNYKIAV